MTEAPSLAARLTAASADALDAQIRLLKRLMSMEKRCSRCRLSGAGNRDSADAREHGNVLTKIVELGRRAGKRNLVVPMEKAVVVADLDSLACP